MANDHEYAILGGLNRARIGQAIGAIASLVSAAIVAVVLALFNVATWMGIGDAIPPVILIPVGAGAVYSVLYWIFDRHVWKMPLIARWSRVPDLSGRWRCEGRTIASENSIGRDWQADVVIVQSWDRIRLRLRTSQSASNSITASMVHDPADGFRLIYSYRNDPKIGEAKLDSHLGFAELLFAPDLLSAQGEYFNGHGRYTFGTLQLTKENG